MRPVAIVAIAAAVLVAGPVRAENWVPMTGAEIGAALTGKVLDYDGAWQDFRASGATLYNAGRDSWGYWQVRDDAYCSQWPPRSEWDCYSMSRDTDTGRVRFEAGDSSATVGTFRE